MEVTEELLEDGVESVTTETEKKEETQEAPKGFISKENARKDVNVQHKKFREEQRQREAAESKAADLEKRIQELETSSVDLTIPPIPDPLDENYHDQIKKRDEAIVRVTAHTKEQSSLNAQQEQLDRDAQTNKEEELNRKVQTFDKNMLELGMDITKVTAAANFIADYGINDTLQDVILEDAEGSLIVSYLQDNPVEISELNGMTPLQMFNHLNAIRPKAQVYKPQTSNAPDPGTHISGGGAGELTDPLLAGVTYE